jgi:hypothetical protein
MSSELASVAEPLTSVPSPDGRRIIPIIPVAADGTTPQAGKCGPCPTAGCNGLTASCVDPSRGAGCCCLACGAFW